MSSPRRGMRLGFVEPHLRRFGGIRRMIEFANRLTARGHVVTFYLPDDVEHRCTWMRCDATVKSIQEGFRDELDVVLFNSEPHWHLLDRFEGARRRVFYALHYARLYGKEGSWESLRAPVDLQLANSNWTADQIFAETGSRPVVQLGGVNREMFHPYPGAKKLTLLTNGERGRSWKGTETVLDAGRLLDIRVESYAGKNLEQPELGRRYAAARVFAVGSWFEGFCQPGLESLACGTALVTTDNGGCREYAIDGETALVVPPRDVPAMAAAIRKLLDDDELSKRLVANGLDVVARDFDWEQRTDEFAAVLDGVCANPAAPVPPPRPDVSRDPDVSVVVPAWDNLRYTQQFVESVRRHTSVPYELVIVDNGSHWEAANYAWVAADRAVLNDANLGFARGMNQGFAVGARPVRCLLQQRHGVASPVGGAAARDRAIPSACSGRRAGDHRRAQSGERAAGTGRRGRTAPAVLRPTGGGRVRDARRRADPARRLGRGVRDRERRGCRSLFQGLGERSRHRLRPASAGEARFEGVGVAARRLERLVGPEPAAVPRQVDGRRVRAPH